ncbi:MAG: MBG domain-containing protein, partial [Erysipelotrichaceae bacterium]|nr:MBG domain-containing protein [Erysipelotrichaceae bacterium]
GLNVDGRTNLTTFNIYKSNISGDLDLSGNTKLQTIKAYNTQINSINVSGLKNLNALHVHNTNIRGDLDLRTNTALQTLNAYNTQLTGVNIDGLTSLVKFDVDDNPNLVGEFDLTSNKGLQVVRARNTKVTGLNITDLTNLTLVDISNNPQFVGAFDFTSNPALEFINANNTNIHSINVQGLRNLTQLGIANTLVPSLDVSTNTSLQALNCDTNLTWLNIADNPNLTVIEKRDSVIDLGQLEDSFNIATVTEAFKGIDPSKVTMVSGATYDPTTGEVSGYQNGTPIVYRYDSGVMQNGEAVTLTVTLNFTKDVSESSIRINNYEGKVYDGTPVSNPTDITTTGSSGEVTFEWYTADGTKLAKAPAEVGNYKVKAILAGDENYKGAETEAEFSIFKASNAWTTELSMQGWVYGEEANTPQAEAQFGKITYTYSTSEDGVYTEEVPSDAGTYWVKAVVEGTDNYEGLEAKVSFTIEKANSSITIDTDLNKVYDGQPVSKPSITQT